MLRWRKALAEQRVDLFLHLHQPINTEHKAGKSENTIFKSLVSLNSISTIWKNVKSQLIFYLLGTNPTFVLQTQRG